VTGDRRLRDERIDLFTYQANEIDTADLTAGEEVALRQDREVLRNAETISATLGDLSRSLFDEDGAAAERLGTATSRLTEIEHWEPQAGTWKEELDEIRVRLEEVVASVRQRADRVEPDPPRLQAVEDRLALIERLCRKYGDTTTEVLAYRDTIGAELEELRGDDEQQHDLAAQTSEALATYREVAQALSERRRKWAGSLIQDLQRELEELSMPAARFEVVLDPRPRAGSPLQIDGEGVEFGAAGFDQVGFLFSPNPGEELHPLSRVASGGELSRVYLALQLLAQGNSAPTLVFDEVDSGVGGVEAVALGRKLKKLAESGQILTVTHLPQVASQGDEHFRVAKEIRGGRTFVSVLGLGREERVDEISRMLGDQEAGTASRNHAEALLAQGAAAAPARR
jgi:DNA repair protein RecN (Recombination protein N)